MAPTPRLRLRKAGLSDSRDIWRWRNDPVTRENSLSSAKIPWPKHRQWFAQALKNSKHYIYIASSGTDKIGVLRHNLRLPGVVEISIHVNPIFRRQGFGRRMLTLSNALVRKKHPRCAQKAIIRPTNRASAAIFSAAGFKVLHEIKNPARIVWLR